jgi:anti-anti-sigma regulatory factor
MLNIAATIEVTDSADGPVLHIGDGVGTDAGPLERVLAGEAARRPKLASIHLHHLSVLTSQLIGVFINFRAAVARGGGRVRLVGLRPGVREDLLRLRLDNLFQIAEGEVGGLAPAKAVAAKVPSPASLVTQLGSSLRSLRSARLHLTRGLARWRPGSAGGGFAGRIWPATRRTSCEV